MLIFAALSSPAHQTSTCTFATLPGALENASTYPSVPATGRGVSPTFCMPLDIVEEEHCYEVGGVLLLSPYRLQPRSKIIYTL
jgi:hypothetical protein